jgi:hypothetical protein
MSKRDELPSKIGHRKLLISMRGELRYRPSTAEEALWRRVCRFLRKQVGRLWSDIWPEVDELLRRSDAGSHAIAELRRRLHRGNPGYCHAHSNGMHLHIDLDTGTLLATPLGRHARFHPQVTFSAAELRHEPERITR